MIDMTAEPACGSESANLTKTGRADWMKIELKACGED